MIIKYSHRKSYILGRIKLGKDKMLTTIVMTLLAIYLSIQLAVMVASGVFSYKFFKSLKDENKGIV